MSGLVGAGTFWCPACCCRRLFVVAEDAAPNDPTPDLECEVCYYVIRKARREYPAAVPGAPGRVIQVDLLGPTTRARAREDFLAELKAHAVIGGARLENWTHGRPT